MRIRFNLLLAIACVGLVSGCGVFDLFSSDEPDVRDDHTAVISGLDTRDLEPREARRSVLIAAAKITVDHGYQYFIVLHREVWTPSGSVRAGTDSAVRPGDDVTIKVFHDGEVPPGARDVFNAEKLLSGGIADAMASGPSYEPSTPGYAPQAWSPANASAPASKTPRCTAYGCSW